LSRIRSAKWKAPILEAPEGRRDEFVEHVTADGVLVAVRAKEARAKGLVEKIPLPDATGLLPGGYRICLVFLKLFERIYAPLSAGLLRPFPADQKVQQQRLSQLDRLYRRVTQALDDLLDAVGLKAA